MDLFADTWLISLFFQVLHSLVTLLILGVVAVLALRYFKVNGVSVKVEVNRRDQDPEKVSGVTAKFEVNRSDQAACS